MKSRIKNNMNTSWCWSIRPIFTVNRTGSQPVDSLDNGLGITICATDEAKAEAEIIVGWRGWC